MRVCLGERDGRVDGSKRPSRARYLCRYHLCMHSDLQSYLLIESSQHTHVEQGLGLPQQPHSEFADGLKGYCGRRFLGSLPEFQEIRCGQREKEYLLYRRWTIAAGGSTSSFPSPTTCKGPCIRLQAFLRHLNHILGHLQPVVPITTIHCLGTGCSICLGAQSDCTFQLAREHKRSAHEYRIPNDPPRQNIHREENEPRVRNRRSHVVRRF
jgi:hypothetical protein